MRELRAPELLEVWERGAMRSPAERALTLLEAACTEREAESLARLSIGRRDDLLLSVRESTFGPRIAAITGCPDCNEELEFDFALSDIRVPNDGELAEPTRIRLVEYEIEFRLPDSHDLMVAAQSPDAEAIRLALLQRCLLSAHRDDAEVAVDQLPTEVLDRLEEEMSRRDAQANVQVQLSCPACRRDWSAPFDILAFFWGELDAWAQRVLVEIHQLASAYGWRERDILEMSPARRNLYLDLVGG